MIKVDKALWGEGLFATENIEKNVIVVQLSPSREWIYVSNGKKMKSIVKSLEQHITRKKNLPRDSIIQFGSYVFWEPLFNENIPLWYKLNHSRKHAQLKVELIIKQEEKPMLVWKTIRAIKKGEELYFDYGEPDPEWKKNDGFLPLIKNY